MRPGPEPIRHFCFLRFCHSPSLAFLLVVLLGSLQPASAQTNPRRSSVDTPSRTYQLRGSVRSAANDMPLEMVRVELKRFTGEIVGMTFTRSNGEFEYNGLNSGEYVLEVNHPGYEPARERVEIMNSSRYGQYVFLKPLPNAQTSAEPSVSARDLAIPGKASGPFRKGMERLINKKDPQGSLEHFDKALANMAGYYEAHHMRGVAYFQLGRLAEAETEFRRSIELSDHKYAEPYFGIAALLTNDKKFVEAMESARVGLAIDADSWRGHFELARALLGVGQAEDAAKSIERARTLKPDYPDVHLVSANINLRRRDGLALLRDLDEFLRLKPDGPVADQVRKMRTDLLARQAAAQVTAPAPIAEKKPQP
jgi:tetratricopeptide (TPR) repeat protein